MSQCLRVVRRRADGDWNCVLEAGHGGDCRVAEPASGRPGLTERVEALEASVAALTYRVRFLEEGR